TGPPPAPGRPGGPARGHRPGRPLPFRPGSGLHHRDQPGGGRRDDHQDDLRTVKNQRAQAARTRREPAPGDAPNGAGPHSPPPGTSRYSTTTLACTVAGDGAIEPEPSQVRGPP